MRKSRQDFVATEARISGRVNLVFSRQIGFPKVSIRLSVHKPMLITEPAVPNALLLGLGLKLYPSNM